MKQFTLAQTTVVQALATGATVTEAAALASVSRTTIYHWHDEPAFQHAVAYAQQEYAITIRDRMQALAAKALDKLEALLDNPNASPSVILKASLAILNRPPQGWTLPSPSVADCAPAIEQASARMEADPEVVRNKQAYLQRLTKLYTKSDPSISQNEPDGQTPRGAPCPCGSGLKFKRCCGKNAPPVLQQNAA